VRRSRAIAAALTVAAVTSLAAQAASAPPSTDWADALAIGKDGRIVVAGMSRRKAISSDNAFALARYTTAGRLDAGFGRGGRVLTSFPSPRTASAVVALPDGRTIAAGGVWTLVRYTRGGRIDSTFGHGGTVTTDFGLGKAAYLVARALAVQPDGKIVAAGSAGRYFALARYTGAGKLDPAFGRGGKVLARYYGDGANAVAIQPDGKILVGATSRIVRYTPHGALDSSFGVGGVVRLRGDVTISSLALEPDGKIVGAGTSNVKRAGPVTGTDLDFSLIRYDGDGRLDASFGDGGTVFTNFGEDPTGNSGGSSDGASVVAVQPDGRIVAAGTTDVRGVFCGGRHLSGVGSRENMSICDDVALARYDDDGSLDPTFAKGGKVVAPSVCCRSGSRESGATAQALGIQRDGKIVVAGLGPGYDFGVWRFTTRGRPDGTFGAAGYVSTDFGTR
jgi:uncharacterized delta-60 repeat protein